MAVTTPVAANVRAFSCPDGQVAVRTQDGVVSFSVEIADTPDERAQGLMFRRELPQGHGMLFIYEKPQIASFWMRNTLIPLDIIFLDKRGIIRHINANARPLDETPIPGAVAGDPDPKRLMVLEIGGGEAVRLSLAPGQPLATRLLDQSDAAWPCG